MLYNLVGAVLDWLPDELHDGVSRTTHTGWDSIRHIELMMTLEAHYRISFSSAEMAAVNSLGQLRSLLAEKGVLDP